MTCLSCSRRPDHGKILIQPEIDLDVLFRGPFRTSRMISPPIRSFSCTGPNGGSRLGEPQEFADVLFRPSNCG